MTPSRLETIRREVKEERSTLRGGDGKTAHFASLCQELLDYLPQAISGASIFKPNGGEGEHPHPWARFLCARADMIDLFFRDGYRDEDIARSLSMDPAQVRMIRTRDRSTDWALRGKPSPSTEPTPVNPSGENNAEVERLRTGIQETLDHLPVLMTNLRTRNKLAALLRPPEPGGK